MNETVVSLVKLVITKIAPRYPEGGIIFIADKYISIIFWDYNKSLLYDALNGVPGPLGRSDYLWEDYYKFTYKEMGQLQSLVKMKDSSDAEIEIVGQSCGKNTIAYIRKNILSDVPEELKEYRIIDKSEATKISWIWDY